MNNRKKLIEVALPLEAINRASAREKSIRHGHPSTLHLWWARRPLAAARAVIFAQMVDDPSEYVSELLGDPKLKRAAQARHKKNLEAWERAHAPKGEAGGSGGGNGQASDPVQAPTLEEAAAEAERERLFKLIEELVQWENTTNEEVLDRARAEIWQSWRRTCAQNADHPQARELFDRHKLPAFHDPFAGGGSLPLEAQRLGLEAHASDLNPVAVLINKAMIEIPPKFAGRPPVNPEARADRRLFEREWKGAQGLAEDVRYYGKWMRDEAEKRIGNLYPKVEITDEMISTPSGGPGGGQIGRPDLKPYLGRKLTVIAWLWARTVKSPNPAFAHVDVPLVSSFMLATKPGKEAYVEPVVEGDTYRFEVRMGKPKDPEAAKAGTKLGRGANFRCVLSGSVVSGDYIKAEGQAGRMGARMMAIVAEGDRGRVYLAPTAEHEEVARQAKPEWKPEVEFFQQALGFRVGNYGMTTWSDLFTERQLVALSTLADLAGEAPEQICLDAASVGMSEDGLGLDASGLGAHAYGEAVGVYLNLAVSKSSDYWSNICTWRSDPKNLGVGHVFSRQAIQMTWDFAEGNPFSSSSGSWPVTVDWIYRTAQTFYHGTRLCAARQIDAGRNSEIWHQVISTDPPYYDNIGYADLSDFFYVWLRRSLQAVYPSLFATMAVPKAEELVATPNRHGGREAAESFFLEGMTRAMGRLAQQAHPGCPVTIYYAFKQSESEGGDGTASTGWETFLDAVIQAGFGISGTWPMRTELGNRTRGMGSNALASSIVLVCRPRPADAPTATRREFVTALKAELPAALKHLQKGNIAPVDLQQAAIGPGMAVYTRYAKVLDAAGNPVSVREALALINQVLDEVLAEQEGDFDGDTRWALAWFEQFGFDEGEFGVAETLSKAKNTSVNGIVEAGVAASRAGKVRLLRPRELPADWNPSTDTRLTVWEMVHHLVRTLDHGEEGAASLVAALGSQAESARELAYRLYSVCERKKRAAEALDYNALVQAWPTLVTLAQSQQSASATPVQEELF
jgi:putative DNA methylase